MKFHSSAIAAVFSIAAGNAMSADIGGGNIEFKGQVHADTCYVESKTGNAHTLHIEIGSVNTDRIDQSTPSTPIFPTGATNGQLDFRVVCKAITTGVTLALAAPAGSTDTSTSVLKVNNGITGDGLAEGVGIAVYPNRSSTTAYDLTNAQLLQRDFAAGQSISVSLAATYVKTGNMVPGVANATLPFVITSP